MNPDGNETVWGLVDKVVTKERIRWAVGSFDHYKAPGVDAIFPVEQAALLNDIIKVIGGHVVTDSQRTISKLLKDNTMEKIIENVWNRMWTKFVTFGSAIAGIFSIFIIIQGVYGWSIQLLGVLWGSLATLFLFLGQSS